MRKRQSDNCEEPQGSARQEITAPSIASRRDRLAKLVGRLLSRSWLREKNLETHGVPNAPGSE